MQMHDIVMEFFDGYTLTTHKMDRITGRAIFH
jgi:hypothetical protein